MYGKQDKFSLAVRELQDVWKVTKRNSLEEPAMADAKKSGRKRKTAARTRPFDIEAAMPLLREAVAPYPKAALFELAAEGHTSVFELLVGCIISIRTRDETTLPTARRLFARARSCAEVSALSPDEIDELIG